MPPSAPFSSQHSNIVLEDEPLFYVVELSRDDDQELYDKASYDTSNI